MLCYKTNVKHNLEVWRLEVCLALKDPESLSAIASRDSYASFMLSNLLCASITRVYGGGGVYHLLNGNQLLAGGQ